VSAPAVQGHRSRGDLSFFSYLIHNLFKLSGEDDDDEEEEEEKEEDWWLLDQAKLCCTR
jgi:hypothetical protein